MASRYQQGHRQRGGQWCPAPPFEIGVPPFHVWRPGCYIHPILYLKNEGPPSGFWPPAAKSWGRAWLSAVTVSLHCLPKMSAFNSHMRQNTHYCKLTWILEDLLSCYCYAIKTNIGTIRSHVSQPAAVGKEVNCKLITACMTPEQWTWLFATGPKTREGAFGAVPPNIFCVPEIVLLPGKFISMQKKSFATKKVFCPAKP